MAKQIHVTVRDEQYRFLRWESAKTELSMAHLIRTALDNEYGLEFGEVEPGFAPHLCAGRPLELDADAPAVAFGGAHAAANGNATAGDLVRARPSAEGSALRSLARRVRQLLARVLPDRLRHARRSRATP
jgi:hypothetical protein